MKNKQPSMNYLDMIPEHNSIYPYETDDKGKVTIMVENKGFFNMIAQKFFKRPKVSQVHLDKMGNFVWPLIDGVRTVDDIAQLVKAEFGEKAEPLYPRIVQYMHTLEAYQFIIMREK